MSSEDQNVPNGQMQPTENGAADGSNEQQKTLEALQTQSKKMKKRILIIFACIVGGLVLLFGLVKLIDHLANKDSKIPQYDFDFYPTYEGDIMKNKQYLSLDRQIYYCEDPSGDGLKVAVNEENMTDFDTKVMFLYFYLQTIIGGDADIYNSFFNQTYFQTSEPQASFSPQMLYQMEITYQSSENAENGEKLVTYCLEYKIYRNDGTFRRDIGSDSSRPQYMTLRVSAAGDISIEKLVTVYEVTKN